MKLFLFLIICTTLSCCLSNSPTDTTGIPSNSKFPKDTVMSLYQATITLPAGWSVVKDTLPPATDATCRYKFHNSSGKLVRLTYGLSTSRIPDDHDTSNYDFKSGKVSGFSTVYFQAKQGNGFTGIYIDSIGVIAGNVAALLFYGENLQQQEQDELYRVSQSLHLQPFTD